MTYTFEIVSPKYGSFIVTAPTRFRSEIEERKWFVCRDPQRAAENQFSVGTHLSKSDDYRILQLHAFIWDLAGRPPVGGIDHIDGDPLNNAEDNLRDGKDGNARNRRRQRNNSSGVIGVSRLPQGKSWRAQIQVGGRGKVKYLGCFDDITTAQIVRDVAAVKLHAEFAVLNSPPNPAITDEEYRALLTELAA